MTLLVSYCLFSFEFSFSGSKAVTIRPDDFIILALALLTVRRRYLPAMRQISLPLALLTLLELLSAVINAPLRGTSLVEGLLYSGRPAEYYVFVFVGAYLAENSPKYLNKALALWVVWLSVLSVGQIAGVLGGISQFAFSRASGNVSGPYELAAISAGLSVYFWSSHRQNIALLAILPLVLSASRITAAGLAALVLFALTRSMLTGKSLRLSYGFFTALIVVIPLGVLSLLATGSSISVVNRLNSTHLDQSLHSAEVYAYSYPPVQTQQQYMDLAYSGLNPILLPNNAPDASTQLRFTRWLLLLRGTTRSPAALLVGLGPSFSGAAVDGYYVRIFTEAGVVGLVLFLWLLRRIFQAGRRAPGVRSYLFILSVTGMFIDIFVTYKAMMLLWMMLGFGVMRASSNDNPGSLK